MFHVDTDLEATVRALAVDVITERRHRDVDAVEADAYIVVVSRHRPGNTVTGMCM